MFLKDGRFSFIEQMDSVQKLKFQSLLEETPRRLVERFIAEAKRSEMHRNHHLRAELSKSLQGLFRIHMNVALSRRFIGSDWQQSDIDVRTRADFSETCEVRGVAAVKDRATGILEEKTSKSAMTIMKNARAPVAGRR